MRGFCASLAVASGGCKLNSGKSNPLKSHKRRMFEAVAYVSTKARLHSQYGDNKGQERDRWEIGLFDHVQASRI